METEPLICKTTDILKVQRQALIIPFHNDQSFHWALLYSTIVNLQSLTSLFPVFCLHYSSIQKIVLKD